MTQETSDLCLAYTRYLFYWQWMIFFVNCLLRQFFYNNSLIRMASKYNYDHFTITVQFRTDFSLSMTAINNHTDEYFASQTIELTKIKKDTVIAAFSRKNEKNIKCEFNTVDVEPKKLMISFVVNYDFLPTFTQYVALEYIKRQAADLKKAENFELKLDIQELNKRVAAISRNENTIIAEHVTSTLNNKTLLFTQEQTKGSYLMEVTGHHSDGQASSNMKIIFEYGEKTKEYNLSLYQNSTYGYPFSLRQTICLENDDKVCVYAQKLTFNGTGTLTGVMVTMMPVYQM